MADSGDPLDRLATEAVLPGLADLDQRPTAEVVRLLLAAEARAQANLAAAAERLAQAAEAAAARLEAGGRLFYAGAGTSGRLGMLDAVECGPTFGVGEERIVALIAGGEEAFHRAVEGAEDNAEAAAAALASRGLSERDAVVAISASGCTPFALGALAAARLCGALAIALVNTLASPLAAGADLAVEIPTGPEVIAGSTRLAAGTTQKIALNTLSTAIMVRLGKTFGPYMVDLVASNAKLRRRAMRMVVAITGASEEEAAAALAAAGGRVKVAIVMLLAGIKAKAAARRLAGARGRVRDAL